MKNRSDAHLTQTLVDVAAATFGVFALTLVMPMSLAESLFRTQFGPMGLSMVAAGVVFGRYLPRSHGPSPAVAGAAREMQPSAS